MKALVVPALSVVLAVLAMPMQQAQAHGYDNHYHAPYSYYNYNYNYNYNYQTWRQPVYPKRQYRTTEKLPRSWRQKQRYDRIQNKPTYYAPKPIAPKRGGKTRFNHFG